MNPVRRPATRRPGLPTSASELARDRPRGGATCQDAPASQPKPRKGQGSVKLTREEFERRLRERFYDPAFERVERRARATSSTSPGTRTTSTARARARGRPAPASPTRTTSCRWNGSTPARRSARRERRTTTPTAPRRVLLICGAARHDQTCPGEMSKTFRLAQIAARARSSGARLRVRLPRPEPADRRVRPSDPAVQGLRLDRDAALPLAVLLLPEPRDGPGQRLDERDLPALGRRARRDDRDAGLLVPGAERAEADDGSARLRRRRQSRSDHDPRQEPGRRPRRWSCAGWHYPRHLAGRAVRGRRPRRRGGRGDAAPLAQRLADRHAAGAGGTAASIDRYIGYYEPYATSHEALDRDTAVQEEVAQRRARALVDAVRDYRAGKRPPEGERDDGPRPK